MVFITTYVVVLRNPPGSSLRQAIDKDGVVCRFGIMTSGLPEDDGFPYRLSSQLLEGIGASPRKQRDSLWNVSLALACLRPLRPEAVARIMFRL